MKASKVRRKAANALCKNGGGIRSARKFRVTPMFGNGDKIPVGYCKRQVGETKLSRTRWLRGKRRTVNVLCGGVVVATRGRSRRKVFCVACRDRRAEARHIEQTRRNARPWLRPNTTHAPSKFGRLFHRRHA